MNKSEGGQLKCQMQSQNAIWELKDGILKNVSEISLYNGKKNQM